MKEEVGRTYTVSCGGGPQAVFNVAARAPRACFNRIKGVKSQAVHVYSSKTKTLRSLAVKCKGEVEYLLALAWSYKGV